MSSDSKQLRSLLGGLRYYRKFQPKIPFRIRRITAILKNDATRDFTSVAEDIVRALHAETRLSYRDAFINKCRPYRPHCDAGTAGLGATYKQE